MSPPIGPTASGGQGVRSVFNQEKYSRADLRLVAQMLENPWQIPAEVAESWPARITEIAMGRGPDGHSASMREQIAAGRLLLMMRQQNWNMATVALGKTDLHLHVKDNPAASDGAKRSAALAAINAELAKRRIRGIVPPGNGELPIVNQPDSRPTA